MTRLRRYQHLRCAATLLLTLTVSQAAASCLGSSQLGRLEALLTGIAGSRQDSVARTLASAVLSHELPDETEVDPRFQPALSDVRQALTLATAGSGGLVGTRDLALALEGLGTALDRSGCVAHRTPLASNSSQSIFQAANKSPPRRLASTSTARAYRASGLLAALSGALLVSIVTGLSAYVLYRRFEPRTARRHPFIAPVKVTTTKGGETRLATSLDLSRSGLKLSGGQSGTRGEKVTLAFEEIEVQAVIRWTNDYYYGAEFRPALSRQQVRRLLAWNSSQEHTTKTKAAPG